MDNSYFQIDSEAVDCWAVGSCASGRVGGSRRLSNVAFWILRKGVVSGEGDVAWRIWEEEDAGMQCSGTDGDEDIRGRRPSRQTRLLESRRIDCGSIDDAREASSPLTSEGLPVAREQLQGRTGLQHRVAGFSF